MRRLVFGFCFTIALSGCKFNPPVDPNDPKEVGLRSADLILDDIRMASNQINERVRIREITVKQGSDLLASYAAGLVPPNATKSITEGDAWKYAEIFRTARNWRLASETLMIALKHPADEDRRVNDTLRLAQAEANLGQVKEAIARARSVFNAKDADTAPILPAVLYEITPGAAGKGLDRELAHLVLDAALIHEKTLIDLNTEAGRRFLQARPHHLEVAMKEAKKLLDSADKVDH